MPNETAHLAQAAHNQEVIDYLLPENDRFSDWITTVAFYKALHIVEAVFAHSDKAKHGQRHEQREAYLKTDHRYAHIYAFYRKLQAASVVARYLQSDSMNEFSHYLSPGDVKDKVLGHWLPQLQASSLKFLSAGAREKLT